MGAGSKHPAVPRTLKLFFVLEVIGKIKQPAKSQRDSSVHHHAVMRILLAIGFPIYVPKNEVFGGFESEYVKILCSNPQQALYPA